jgi:hypothetical protein
VSTDTDGSQPAVEDPKGVTPAAGSGPRSGFLSDVIVELGFAERETVEQAVHAARSPGTAVARVLVETGAITEEQLARATAKHYGIDYLDLDGFEVDPAAANLIKPTAARRYQAVPVAFLGSGLLVAMADPADALGVNDIAVMTKLDVRPAVASRPALDALLEALPLDELGYEGGPQPAAEPAEAAEPDAPAEAEQPTSSAVFWQEGGGEELPAAATRTTDAGDAGTLRDELESVRRQLAGAADAGLGGEAKPADAELEELRQERDAARADAKGAERIRERLDSVKAERDEARERAREAVSELRRLRADAEVRTGELESLRAKVTAAETELVHMRGELDTRGSELDAVRTRAESAERETEEALRRTGQLEREAEDALRHAGDLESRLSEVEGAAFAAERSFEELRVAQHRMRGALRALADPDAPDED